MAAASIAELRQLLDAIGDALLERRVDVLVTLETRVEGAVRAVQLLQHQPLGVPDRAELTRCVAALRRCQRLGEASRHLGTGLLQVIGSSLGYTRDGDVATYRPLGRLEAKV